MIPGKLAARLLTAAERLDAHRAIADANLPAEQVTVSADGITVLANPVSAIRWRETHGDQLAGFPLHIISVQTIERASSC